MVKIKFKVTIRKAMGDQLNREVIIRSSPRKLVVGGNAMLNIAINNHHDQARGKINAVPRRIIIARELVRS